jgi:hypothetical protein
VTSRPAVVRTALAAPSLSPKSPTACPSTLPWSDTVAPTLRASAAAKTARINAAMSSGGISGSWPSRSG